MAIFYSGSLISGPFGNLIAAGMLSGLSGARGIKAWQWLYILEGSIKVFFFGVVTCFPLADSLHAWRMLTEKEKFVPNRPWLLMPRVC
jgi:MFS family permease